MAPPDVRGPLSFPSFDRCVVSFVDSSVPAMGFYASSVMPPRSLGCRSNEKEDPKRASPIDIDGFLLSHAKPPDRPWHSSAKKYLEVPHRSYRNDHPDVPPSSIAPATHDDPNDRRGNANAGVGWHTWPSSSFAFRYRSPIHSPCLRFLPIESRRRRVTAATPLSTSPILAFAFGNAHDSAVQERRTTRSIHHRRMPRNSVGKKEEEKKKKKEAHAKQKPWTTAYR